MNKTIQKIAVLILVVTLISGFSFITAFADEETAQDNDAVNLSSTYTEKFASVYEDTEDDLEKDYFNKDHNYAKTDGVVKCSSCGELFTGVWTDGYEYSDGRIVCSIDNGGYALSNGQIVKGEGIIKIDNDYYYVNNAGTVVNYNGTAGIYSTVSEAKSNGLINTGTYKFDTDGKIINVFLKNGYYYKDGQICKGAGLVKINDDIYFVNVNGAIVKDCYQTVSETKSNGLKEAGTYKFDSAGKLITCTIKKGYYYENDELCKGVGVVCVENEYYYINNSGKIANYGAATQIYYTLKSEKVNNLIKPGEYKIDTDGKIISAFIYKNYYYYVNGSISKGNGIIKLDGKLYYVNNSGFIFKNGTATIKETKVNGLCEAGAHTFDANGVMIK